MTSATQIVWRMIKSLVWSGGLTRFADTPGGAGIAPPPTSLPDMVCCDDDEWTAGGDARADGLELFKKFFQKDPVNVSKQISLLRPRIKKSRR